MTKLFEGIALLFDEVFSVFNKKTNIRNYKISHIELAKFNSSIKKTVFNLDPLETKFLYHLTLAAESGISVFEINKLFHLNKLSIVNQRVRRHIIIKEMNLKLFMITDNRECIIRVASEDDKRVKFYYLIKEARSSPTTVKYTVIDKSSK